ncbi:antistasin [Biomphalaria pfeifferi]|uniref:Antistasin n=1 Tax=Biomphalaria pfeifferi TaxID=112525 RepID=A0AAD8AWA6_BIOPF|nr:antistasin [Biomphalaria pfeifferi]
MSVRTLQAVLVVLAVVAVLQVAARDDSSSREFRHGGKHQKEKPCRLACPFGQVVDKRRCRCLAPFPNIIRVQCPPLVCPSVCSAGAVITTQSNGCKVCKCGAQKVCRPVLCRMGCPNGWAKGEDGCDECRCKAPSRQNVCPPVLCSSICLYGYLSDNNGCRTCRCNTDPGPIAS